MTKHKNPTQTKITLERKNWTKRMSLMIHRGIETQSSNNIFINAEHIK